MIRKIITIAVLLLMSANTYAFSNGKEHKSSRIKNVIVLIPDGCSQNIQTLARWYKGEKLTLDDLNVGVVKQEMANSVITGSAAAATAFATGYKTTVRFLSVGPREDDVLSTYKWPFPPESFSYRPLATVLEGAKLKGMATGLISTSRFTHATPAAWACHSMDRGNEHTDIAEQMVYNEVDLIFGGGERNLVPTTMGGKRIDGEDLREVLLDRGYKIVRTKAEMDALTSFPVFGMFAWSHMDADIDRPGYNPDEPSLSEMTSKAINILSEDEEGFFLQVEGSQVDWAGHNNDPVYMVTDFIEFDKAVKVSVDFARKDGHTLVLAYPDHNTGGMSVGNRNYNVAYTHLSIEELVEPLKGMTVTAEALSDEIEAMAGGITVENIKTKTLELWNLHVSDEVAQEIINMTGIQEGYDNYTVCFSYALARVLSEHYTAIGWTSHGHNAGDVPLWAYGPGAPKGLLDNTELAKVVADALDINMMSVNLRLYVDLDEVFENWTLDKSDPLNPVVRAEGRMDIKLELPCSKDLLIVNTEWEEPRIINLEGLVVYAPMTERVYVPHQAVKLMRRYGVE